MLPNEFKTDYIIFLDESGDHDLTIVDPKYPVFALTGCVFKNDNYFKKVVPLVHSYKQELFNSTDLILHSRDIRKCIGDFAQLCNAEFRNLFYRKTEQLMKSLEFNIICSVIKKADLKLWYSIPKSPYSLTLCFIMERFRHFLNYNRATGHIIAESRDIAQNKDLLNVFNCLMQGNSVTLGFPTYIKDFSRYITGLTFYEKKLNISGLQIADMCAYPFGRKIIDPYKENLSYNIIEPKLYGGYQNQPHKFGLKVFP